MAEGGTIIAIEKDGKYHCPDCDKAFDSPQAVGAHRNKAHGYRRPKKGIPVITGDHRIRTSDYQRSLDETKLDEFLGSSPSVTGKPFDPNYGYHLRQFLPALAEEIRDRRVEGEGGELVTAFFILFTDQANI